MDLPASYSAAELSSIEACKRLVIEFASLIDANRTDELIQLLLPEATFARPTAPDIVVTGAQTIVQATIRWSRARDGRQRVRCSAPGATRSCARRRAGDSRTVAAA